MEKSSSVPIKVHLQLIKDSCTLCSSPTDQPLATLGKTHIIVWQIHYFDERKYRCIESFACFFRNLYTINDVLTLLNQLSQMENYFHLLIIQQNMHGIQQSMMKLTYWMIVWDLHHLNVMLTFKKGWLRKCIFYNWKKKWMRGTVW